MIKLNVLLLFLVLTLYSCQPDNETKLLNVEWKADKEIYSVQIKDSMIYFNVPDSNRKFVDTESICDLVLKIKSVSEKWIITTGNKNNRNDSIAYGIRYINGKPILILNFIITKFKIPEMNAIAFSTTSEIDLEETKDFNIPSFELEGYHLNDTISLDSVSYTSDIFNQYSLLRNPNIKLELIGNRIVSISKNNIKEYEINDILISTDKKFKAKNFKISDLLYIWQDKNGDKIRLGLDIENQYDGVNVYSLNYTNTSVENLATIEFKNNTFYDNVKNKKEKVSNLMSQLENNLEVNSMSNIISKVLIIDNRFADAYYVKGQLSKIQKMFISAENDFKKCIEINPYHTEATIELGLLYFDLKRYDEFVESMERAINLNSKKPEVYRALTIYYYDVKKDKETGCTYAKLAYECGDKQMLNIINEFCK